MDLSELDQPDFEEEIEEEAPVRERETECAGIKGLCADLIIQAFKDARRGNNQAIQWFKTTNHYLAGFEICCAALDLDYQHVGRVMLREAGVK